MKDGNIPISPPGWHIQVEVRPNGIQWNGVNSQFDVEEPPNTIVLANKVPDITESYTYKSIRGKNGKMRKVRVRNGWEVSEYLIYSPYTLGTHRQEIVSAGDSYLRSIIEEAITDLGRRGVKSQAAPEYLLADCGAGYNRLSSKQETQ